MKWSFWYLSFAAFAFAQQPAVLTLNEALQEAFAKSFSMERSRLNTSVAEQNSSVARSGLFPTLSLGSDLSKPGPNLRQDPWLNPASRGAYETVWRTSLQAKWVVFNGGVTRLGYESSKQQAELSRQREIVQRQMVAAQVTIYYCDIARQQWILDLQRNALQFSQERLKIAQAKRSAGSASLLEEQQAQLDRNADSAAFLRQNLAVLQAKRQLNATLQRPLESDLRVDSLLAIDTSLAQKKVAAESSPEVQVANLQLAAKRAETKAVGREWLPELSVYANYQFLEQFSAEHPPADGHYQGMLYGAQISMPLFEGGRSAAKVRSARDQERIAEIQAQELKSEWEKEVSLATHAYQQALVAYALERENAVLANATLDIALKQYELGAISSLDLRRMQESQMAAQVRLFQVQFEAKNAEVQLLLLTGSL